MRNRFLFHAGRFVGLLLASVLCMVTVDAAATSSLHVEFNAVIAGISDFGFLPEEIEVGDTLSGFHEYNLNALDLDPDPHRGVYEYAAATNRLVVFADAGWVFRTNEANVLVRFTLGDSLIWGSSGPADTYRFWSAYNTGSAPQGGWLAVSNMFVDLVDSSLVANDSDDLPTDAPTLDNWQDRKLLVITGADGGWAIFAEMLTTSLAPTSILKPRPDTRARLGLNSPNPFNPSTKIPFSVTQRQKATIVIYDVNGNVVRHLIDDVYESGTHEANWNGRDDTGRQVVSGIYFYCLTAGGHSITRKATLLK